MAATGPAQPKRRAWIINALVLAAVAIVLVVAFTVDPPTDALVVTMMLGVPLILVVITTLVVARRSR